jgi:hypothetical protein
MTHSEPIDLDFRPASYFRPAAPRGLRLAQREERAGPGASAQNSSPPSATTRWPASCARRACPEDECRALERIHPLFMGGNYLPNPRPGEVEIARIFIYSTTGDVTAVYARRVGPRIRYRVVDEYAGETLREERRATQVRSR